MAEIRSDAQQVARLASAVSILRAALSDVAQRHHDTLTGSRKHDPQKIASFRDCECLSCHRASTALAEVETKMADG